MGGGRLDAEEGQVFAGKGAQSRDAGADGGQVDLDNGPYPDVEAVKGAVLDVVCQFVENHRPHDGGHNVTGVMLARAKTPAERKDKRKTYSTPALIRAIRIKRSRNGKPSRQKIGIGSTKISALRAI